MHQDCDKSNDSARSHLAREWELFQAVETGTADCLWSVWESPRPVVVTRAQFPHRRSCHRRSLPRRRCCGVAAIFWRGRRGAGPGVSELRHRPVTRFPPVAGGRGLQLSRHSGTNRGGDASAGPEDGGRVGSGAARAESIGQCAAARPVRPDSPRNSSISLRFPTCHPIPEGTGPSAELPGPTLPRRVHRTPSFTPGKDHREPASRTRRHKTRTATVASAIDICIMAQIFKGQSTHMFETVEIAFGKFAGSRHILAGAAALITLFSSAPSAAQTGTAAPPPGGQTNPGASAAGGSVSVSGCRR